MPTQIVQLSVVAMVNPTTPGYPLGTQIFDTPILLGLPVDANNFYVQDAALTKQSALRGASAAVLNSVKSEVLLYQWKADDQEPAPMSLFCTLDPDVFESVFGAQGLTVNVKAMSTPGEANKIFATPVKMVLPTRFHNYFLNEETTPPVLEINGKPTAVPEAISNITWWQFAGAPVVFY